MKAANSAKRPMMAGGGGPGGRMMMSGGERADDFRGTLGRLLGMLRPYLWGMAVVIGCNILSNLAWVQIPKTISIATNEMMRASLAALSGEAAALSMPLILRVMLWILCFQGLMSFGDWMVSYRLASISQRVVYDLRQQVDQKLARLPLSYFDSMPVGDILSRSTNDIDTISNSLQSCLSQAFSAVLSILLGGAMMLSISPTLTVIGLITMPLASLFSGWLVKRSQKYFRGQQKALGDLGGFVEETYHGLELVQAFGQQHAKQAAFSDYNDALYHDGWKAQFCSGIMMPCVMFFTNIGYVLTSVVGGLLVLAGRLLVGDVQAMIQYLRSISHPVAMIANIMNILQSGAAAAERIFTLLDAPEESETPLAASTPVSAEQVEISHLSFSYQPGIPVLRDISVTAHRGERIAIVGATGSGKTTLVNLLLRFYEPDSGCITLDGVDISTLPRNALRQKFGMVLQDTWLFGGTIRENIRYGSLAATDAMVEQAAKAACADAFIRQLPCGYDFVLGEEAENISQGQRQLLTIARAFLADPDILILDEATSSVDTRTEQLISSGMTALMKNRTSFVIAHRLSTILDADCILLLEQGRILERGSHAALMQENGAYRRLFESQFAEQD